MSDRKLRYTSEARSDFRSILRYGRATWGVGRRDAYAEKLNAAIASLASFPNLGTSRDEISPGLRSIPVEEHVVYYRLGPRSVVIVRILHGAMDSASQFER